jgi:hypothetical protein
MSEEEEERNRRTKIRLLLTPSELETLDWAVRESYAPTRSLIIFESFQAGLRNPNLKTRQEKRNRRIDAWTTKEMKHEIRQLACKLQVTQQHLVRHLLLSYIAAAPWRSPPGDKLEKPARKPVEHNDACGSHP